MASLQVSAVCQPLVNGAGSEQTVPISMFSDVSSYFAGALIMACIALFLLARLVPRSPWTPFSRGRRPALISLTNLSAGGLGAVSIFVSILGIWAIQAFGVLTYSSKGTVTTILLGAILFASYLSSRPSPLEFDHLSLRSSTRYISVSTAVFLTPSRRLQDPGSLNPTGVARLIGKGVSTMGDEWDVQVPDWYTPVPYGLRMCV